MSHEPAGVGATTWSWVTVHQAIGMTMEYLNCSGPCGVRDAHHAGEGDGSNRLGRVERHRRTPSPTGMTGATKGNGLSTVRLSVPGLDPALAA